MEVPIGECAFKKQAPTDALVNAALNGVLTFFLLSRLIGLRID